MPRLPLLYSRRTRDGRPPGLKLAEACFLCVLYCAIVRAAGPLEVARGLAPENPQQPQLAVDAQGAIHLVYGVGKRVRYCRSEDGGQTFAVSHELPTVQGMPLGMRRGPRIAVTDQSLCVTVIGGKQGKGRDGDLLAMRSVDGGKNWSDPVKVNDAADSAREGLHGMSSSAAGSVCCVWLDLRNGKTEVMASVSQDGGSSWSRNVLVYKSPDGSVCECCHPSVVVDNRNGIHVQWRNSLQGDRDVYLASSTDGGQTFGKASKLGSGSWRLAACPMDGGAIAALAGGGLASAWRRDQEVFLAVAGDGREQRLGVGEQPWIAATDAGAFVVWLRQRGHTAYLLAPGSTTASELARHAADPVIAAGPNGRGPVVAAWESRDGKYATIQCQVIAGRIVD